MHTSCCLWDHQETAGVAVLDGEELLILPSTDERWLVMMRADGTRVKETHKWIARHGTEYLTATGEAQETEA